MAKFQVQCTLEVDTKESKLVINTSFSRLVCIGARRKGTYADLVVNDRPWPGQINSAKGLIKAIGQQLIQPKHLETHDSTNT